MCVVVMYMLLPLQAKYKANHMKVTSVLQPAVLAKKKKIEGTAQIRTGDILLKRQAL